jgi:hypothetical protein
MPIVVKIDTDAQAMKNHLTMDPSILIQNFRLESKICATLVTSCHNQTIFMILFGQPIMFLSNLMHDFSHATLSEKFITY